MTRLRVVMTATSEYDVDLSKYKDENGKSMTEEEALACDKEGIYDDPISFLDNPCKIDVKIERLL